MQEKHPAAADDERTTPSPEENANWFSKAVFSWTFDLLKVSFSCQPPRQPSYSIYPKQEYTLTQHTHSTATDILSSPKTSQTYIQHMRHGASLQTSKLPSTRTIQPGRKIRYGALSTRPSNGSSGSADYVVAQQIAYWCWSPLSLVS
jgi:hypothetical protein